MVTDLLNDLFRLLGCRVLVYSDNLRDPGGRIECGKTLVFSAAEFWSVSSNTDLGIDTWRALFIISATTFTQVGARDCPMRATFC